MNVKDRHCPSSTFTVSEIGSRRQDLVCFANDLAFYSGFWPQVFERNRPKAGRQSQDPCD